MGCRLDNNFRIAHILRVCLALLPGCIPSAEVIWTPNSTKYIVEKMCSPLSSSSIVCILAQNRKSWAWAPTPWGLKRSLDPIEKRFQRCYYIKKKERRQMTIERLCMFNGQHFCIVWLHDNGTAIQLSRCLNTPRQPLRVAVQQGLCSIPRPITDPL